MIVETFVTVSSYVQVLSFRTSTEVDAYLFDNPMRCPGALHFMDRNATVIGYGIQTNSTPVARRGNFEDPTFKFQIPLQIAAEREIARSLLGGIRCDGAIVICSLRELFCKNLFFCPNY